MKKLYIAFLCLILCACTGADKPEAAADYDFKLAVIDIGASDLEITYYDAEYEEMGRMQLNGRSVNSDYMNYRDTLYHGSYAYMTYGAGRRKSNELIRMNLENGRIDYIPLEDFSTWDIFMNDEKLEVIQSSPSFAYWRTEIPFDGGEKTITEYPDHDNPGMYFPVKNGWIRCVPIPKSGLYQYDDSFRQTDYVSLGERSASMQETPPEEEPFAVLGYDGVYMHDILYVPAQKEVIRWEKNEDGVYENRGLGEYNFALMKITADPLAYEVVDTHGRRINDIEQLDETRIVLCTSKQTIRAVTHGNDTSYYYDYSDMGLCVFDTVSEEFTDIIPVSWMPASCQRAADVLYVTDMDQTVHILDPDTFEEITQLNHSYSRNDYQLARLVVSDPYR